MGQALQKSLNEPIFEPDKCGRSATAAN